MNQTSEERIAQLRAEVLTEAAKALRACVKVLERAAKALAEDGRD